MAAARNRETAINPVYRPALIFVGGRLMDDEIKALQDRPPTNIESATGNSSLYMLCPNNPTIIESRFL